MNDKFGYVYIFCYGNSTINEIILDEEDSELESNELLHKYHFNIDECYIMFTEEKCKINTITKSDL